MTIRVSTSKSKPTKKVKRRPVVKTERGGGLSAYELYRQALEAPPAPQVGPHTSAMQYGTKKTKELCAVFLTWLAKGYVPAVAAQKINVARATVFRWKQEDKEFAEAWEEAVEEGTDLLEQEILRRARDGVDRPVFQQGMMVGLVREYSDNLAAMMLQGRRRAVYGKNATEDIPTLTIRIQGGLPVEEGDLPVEEGDLPPPPTEDPIPVALETEQAGVEQTDADKALEPPDDVPIEGV